MKDIASLSHRLFRYGGSAWAARILLCLAVFISYASIWPNTFVFDDLPLIARNEFLQHWSDLPKLLTSLSFTGGGIPGGFYRPVQMLIYFFIYQTFGPSTVAFHMLNLLLQALNACLLYHFGLRAGFKKSAAFAAALLWAVHPLNSIDVTYMASTAELLWGSFCLIGLIMLLPDFTSRKIWQALIFFILAMCCKESAVVFPALAMATLFLTSKGRLRLSTYLKTWPLWLVAICYTSVRLWFAHNNPDNGNPADLLTRLLTSLATLPLYARLIVWPAGLHFERVFPAFSSMMAWQPVAGALMIGLSLVQILLGHGQRGLALSFGLLWCGAALAPYTGIVVPINALFSEGWMYLPTMGLFLGGAQTAADVLEKSKGMARLLVLALALSLGVTTFFHNKVWRSTETLYQNIPPDEEHSTRLSLFLGPFYMQQGEFDRAIDHMQYEIDHDRLPLILQANLHWKLAMAWLHVPPDRNGMTFTLNTHSLPSDQHIPEAIRELGQALQDSPDFYPAHTALAALYRYQNNSQMADFHTKQADAILKKQGSH